MKPAAPVKTQLKAVKLQKEHLILQDLSQLLKNITNNKRDNMMPLNKDKDLHRQDQELKSKMHAQKQIFHKLVPQYVNNQFKYATYANEFDTVFSYYFIKIKITYNNLFLT